ncbi:MAG: hypothetical protein KAI22_06260, partial [Gammaproteobacteria bacterium]|nr:hypothetical protein [Gammaproteobacteria bacterium]
MVTSVGPEMKFFRWILSHLMLIIVLSLLIYVYWNRSEIWSEEASSEQLNESQSTETKSSKIQDADVWGTKVQGIAYEELETDKSALKAIAIENPNRAEVGSSSEIYQRMKRYRESLSVTEREVMDKAASTFHQVSDDTLKSPVESEIEAKQENLENTEQHILPGKDAAEQISAVAVNSTQQVIDDSAREEVIIVHEAETDDSLENELNEDFEVVISQSPTSSAHNTKEHSTEANSTEENSSEAQTKSLQQQIRNRQKQLQNQMVMLIPFGSESSSDENSS